MVAAAWSGASDADEVVLLVDCEHGVDADVRAIIDQLKTRNRRVYLALNKIDQVKLERLLQLAQLLDAEGIFERVFMISALKGSGVDDLIAFLAKKMPKAHWLYPEDQIADMPTRLLAAEITREQLYLQLHDELPYQTTVEGEGWEELGDGSVKISQAVFVQRPGQKAIILGKGGKQIKNIGARARRELETVLGRRVHLFLFVKVREGWIDDRERYEAMGLEFGN